MDPITNWIKVIGKPSRVVDSGRWNIWDSNGLIVVTKNKKVSNIEIHFLTYYEMFPRDKSLGIKPTDNEGGVPESYFKGIVQIEDGYLARESTRDEFKKSDMWSKFKKYPFPNSYSHRYKLEGPDQVNIVTFTHDGKQKE